MGYGSDVMTLLKKSIDSWYNEISLYNFTSPGFSEQTGHFTALIWKSCVSFGMGFAVNLSTGVVIVSYNCSPTSNVIGQFAQNVLPLVVQPVPPVPVPIPVPTPVPIPVPIPVPVPIPINPLCTKQGIINYLTQVKSAVSRGSSSKTIIAQINYLIIQLTGCLNF